MTHRIRERHAFERLRRDGTRVHSTSLWCNFLSDPLVTPSCTAFAISRAFGPAVARNRFRRRLRALLRTRQASKPLPPGLLLIGVDMASGAATVLSRTSTHVATTDELLHVIRGERPVESMG